MADVFKELYLIIPCPLQDEVLFRQKWKKPLSGSSAIFLPTSLYSICIRQPSVSCTKSTEQTLYSTEKKVAGERGHNSTLSISLLKC